MNFFINSTSYNAIMKKKIDDNREYNREFGRYGDYMTIDETDKEQAKITALQRYLKNHKKKTVPKVVLENYYKETLEI